MYTITCQQDNVVMARMNRAPGTIVAMDRFCICVYAAFFWTTGTLPQQKERIYFLARLLP